jgi:hypothetical protein
MLYSPGNSESGLHGFPVVLVDFIKNESSSKTSLSLSTEYVPTV